MTCGIYKAQNKINGQIYIGQSVRIEERWKEHKNSVINGTSKFYKAIQEFGWDNFEWSIIEECPKENLEEREKYWIDYYDSINNGYNTIYGSPFEKKKYSKLSNEKYDELIQDLIKNILSIKELSNKYNLNLPYIYTINKGEDSRRKKELIYPLRELIYPNKPKRDYKQLSNEEIDNLILDLQEDKLSYKELELKYNANYKFLKRVNEGKKILKEGLQYPLRCLKKHQKLNEQEINDIIKLLKDSSLTMKQIADKYNRGTTFIYNFNSGFIYKSDGLKYPIRKLNGIRENNGNCFKL